VVCAAYRSHYSPRSYASGKYWIYLTEQSDVVKKSSRSLSHLLMSSCKMFICDDLATLFVNIVNFDSVIPEFKRVVGVNLKISSTIR